MGEVGGSGRVRMETTILEQKLLKNKRKNSTFNVKNIYIYLERKLHVSYGRRRNK